MFDLDKAVAGWRAQMWAAGIQPPASLSELELHLREEIECQMDAGIGASEAFQISVQRIGLPAALKTEFDKNNEKKL